MQIHKAFKDLIREQIRQKIVAFEGQAKPSKINSVFKWWSKCISMVIAKTASRNVAYKANKLGELMFARQSEMLMPEEELGSQSPGSYEEDFEDLSSNADLYVFNDQMVQGYRGVNINTRETAAQCLTYSMCQFEAPGGLSLLKLLVTDLWTLLWTILLMHLTRLSSPLLPKKICSVLNVKSCLSRQHILSQLETTVQYSTHTMYRHLCQDEVQL